MDIGSGSKYPANALSNFAPHPFVIDNIECNSMEGFLQSLKFIGREMQEHVCTLVGKKAKFKGKKKKWWTTGNLYWKGNIIKRESQEYTDLLNKAFNQLAKNIKFQKALLATNNAVLKHTIGRSDKSKTVLTRQEFCSILTRIREELKTQHI